MVPRVRINHFCLKTTIDYRQHNHCSLLFWWSIDIEISLLFQQNIEYQFVFTFSGSTSQATSNHPRSQHGSIYNGNHLKSWIYLANQWWITKSTLKT